MLAIPSSGASTAIKSDALLLWSSCATTRTSSLRDRQERAKIIRPFRLVIRPVRKCMQVRPNWWASSEYPRLKARYWLTGSASCVILDDFCMQPLDTQSRGILMDIIEDRHQRRSTMITLYQSKTGTTWSARKRSPTLSSIASHTPRAARWIVRRVDQKRKSKNENAYG